MYKEKSLIFGINIKCVFCLDLLYYYYIFKMKVFFRERGVGSSDFHLLFSWTIFSFSYAWHIWRPRRREMFIKNL